MFFDKKNRMMNVTCCATYITAASEITFRDHPVKRLLVLVRYDASYKRQAT